MPPIPSLNNLNLSENQLNATTISTIGNLDLYSQISELSFVQTAADFDVRKMTLQYLTKIKENLKILNTAPAADQQVNFSNLIPRKFNL